MIDENIDFCLTQDGSAGLFNKEVNDIYHSTYGAKAEALEKFVRPLNLRKNFAQKKFLKVLDICYGIGYNTKTFLEEVIKLNINSKIEIDILEYDKRLVLISPFIKDNIKTDIISYILFKNLSDIYDSDIFSLIDLPENRKFLIADLRRFNKKILSPCYNFKGLNSIRAFLHNIYYQYVSNRNKKHLKYLKNNEVINIFPEGTRNHSYDSFLPFKGAFSNEPICFLLSLFVD